MIDVSPMDAVGVGDGSATIGAGARLGAIYDALDEHGVTIPAGCGTTVGIAGLTLGGGLGIMGRRHGLLCDSLAAATIVLADGRTVTCSDDEHPDLFWALRGAGNGALRRRHRAGLRDARASPGHRVPPRLAARARDGTRRGLAGSGRRRRRTRSPPAC